MTSRPRRASPNGSPTTASSGPSWWRPRRVVGTRYVARTGVPGGDGRSTNRAERRPPSTRSVSESSGVRAVVRRRAPPAPRCRRARGTGAPCGAPRARDGRAARRPRRRGAAHRRSRDRRVLRRRARGCRRRRRRRRRRASSLGGSGPRARAGRPRAQPAAPGTGTERTTVSMTSTPVTERKPASGVTITRCSSTDGASSLTSSGIT